jgi:hypothetical protein
MLTGIWTPSHFCCEQVPPGGVQMPQLALQQTSPTLHVLGPHAWLVGEMGPHCTWLHDAPGGRQMPQLALQHTCPSGQNAVPQRTPRAAASSTRGGAEPASGGRATAAREASGGGITAPTEDAAERNAVSGIGTVEGDNITSPSVRPPASRTSGVSIAATTAASIVTSSAGRGGAGNGATVDASVGAATGSLATTPASTALQSFCTHAGVGAGAKKPRLPCPSSHRVKATAPAQKATSTMSAPIVQPGRALMRESSFR